MAKKRIKPEDMDWVQVGEMPKLDVTLIPEAEKRSLCMTILNAVKDYYSDPENMRKYQEWKEKKDAKAALQGAAT